LYDKKTKLPQTREPASSTNNRTKLPNLKISAEKELKEPIYDTSNPQTSNKTELRASIERELEELGLGPSKEIVKDVKKPPKKGLPPHEKERAGKSVNPSGSAVSVTLKTESTRKEKSPVKFSPQKNVATSNLFQPLDPDDLSEGALNVLDYNNTQKVSTGTGKLELVIHLLTIFLEQSKTPKSLKEKLNQLEESMIQKRMVSLINYTVSYFYSML
jgi:hypothetical protein